MSSRVLMLMLMVTSFLLEIRTQVADPRPDLLVQGTTLHRLTKHHLKQYADYLEHLALVEVPKLHEIEAGCLSELPKLRSLYIWRAPLLKHLPHNILKPAPPLLRSLRIINSGLEELPDLSSLVNHSHPLHIIDFEGNKIKKLRSNGIRVRVDQLSLDRNDIEEIEEYAFEGSEFAELSLRGNVNLKVLHELSFAGIIGIRVLDISNTAIVSLSAIGLSTMEVLKAQNTISMKKIPSIHEFKNLKQAHLTHHFHCCAFKFPERHDPERHKLYLAYVAHMKQLCSRTGDKEEPSKRKKRTAKINEESEKIEKTGKHYNDSLKNGSAILEKSDVSYLLPAELENDYGSWSELILDSGETEEYAEQDDEDIGTFHHTPMPTLSENDVTIFCDNETEKLNWWEEVRCWPQSDALNPCEDVLGGLGARILGWVASVAATLGNLAVTAVLLTRPLGPPRLLLLQLTIADLGTALYLMLIAAVDTFTADNYFNHAYDWQYGIGCKLAGFLAVWGAQASLLALAALTLERWLAITHALLPQRRLSVRGARILVSISVIYSLFLAAFPLFGASHYSSTSICLPMRHQNWIDSLYLSSLLIGGLFCLVVVIACYVHIYLTLARDTPLSSAISGDARVANKMAILISTHMACCIPVAAVGFGALIGHPILGVHGAKLLLVLIYPLNSLADPFLYAILTHQFRRDLYLLLDRYGLCSRRAQEYKIPGVIGRERRCRTNSRVARRPNGSLTTGYEDLLL